MFGGIKNTVFGGNQGKSDAKLVEENQKLTRENANLIEENNKLREFQGKSKERNLTNLFTGLFSENKGSNEETKELTEFLAEQFIFYGIEEEEVDYLNSISSEIGKNSLNLVAFKQRLIEKNLRDAVMNRNIAVNPVEQVKQPEITKEKEENTGLESLMKEEPITAKKTRKGWDEDEDDSDLSL